jgi:predicted enzyme related to lactoylglutathione lyase
MPSWLDLGTTDIDGAEKFYGELFGWTADRQPAGEGMVYSMQTIDGKAVAGIYEQPQDQRDAGIPPNWLTYITVGDVDATAAKVEPAGGTVAAPPFDVMDAGRMSVISDPSGGVVGLWQAGQNIGSELNGVHGSFAWAELISTDPPAAEQFLKDVLSVDSAPMPNGPGGYTLLMVDGEPAGGIMQRPEEMGEAPSHWMNYFQVDSAEATASKAAELGAKIVAPPFDSGGPGIIAVLQDPQGAFISVIEPNVDFNPFE